MGLFQYEEPSGTSQYWPEPGVPVLGATTILPKGWTELSRLFRVHYASELSFIHHPSLIEPYIFAANHSLGAGSREEDGTSTTEAQPDSPSGLILALLSHPFWHCQ